MCPWVFPLQRSLRNNGNKREVGTGVPKNRRRGRMNGGPSQVGTNRLSVDQAGELDSFDTVSHHSCDDSSEAELSHFLCIN